MRIINEICLKVDDLNKKELDEYDPTKDSDVIIWSKGKKLTWQDFQGIPDPENEYGALTESMTIQKTDPIIKKNETQFEFKLGNIKTFALFQKSGSWVKDPVLNSKNQDIILEHEQGHFDISEIFSRQFEKALRNESVKIHSCEGRNHNETQKNADNKTEQILKKIGGDVNTKHDQYSEKYEIETDHGENSEIQNNYTIEIQKLLKF